MKKLAYFSFLLLLVHTLSAQRISPLLFGQNAWMPYQVGNRVYYGRLDELWPLVEASNVKFIRYGGNGVEFNRPTIEQYISMVDSIRGIGAEPILQIPQGRGAYDATQAANIVDSVNMIMGRNVKYWSIGNEPDHGDSLIDAAGVSSYIKSFASAMKAIDSTILIAGPEYAGYNSTDYAAFLGGAHDITGKDTNGRFYVDIITFHTYPFAGNQNRNQVITWPSSNLLPTVNDLLIKIRVADSLHERRRKYALKWAITEFNVNYLNPGANTVEGVGVHSFLNGQMWAQVFGIAMKKKALTVTPWSIHESGGNRTIRDLGYLDGRDTLYPRSSYYHQMLLSENIRGNVAASSTNQANVKAIASKDSNQVAVVVLNMDSTANYTFSLRLDNTLPAGTDTLKIRVKAGIPVQYQGYIPAQSTTVLVFDSSGVLIKVCDYGLTHAQSNLAPICITSVAFNKAVRISTIEDSNKKGLKADTVPLVFPNPASDKVTIQLSEKWQHNTHISLLNAQGQAVISEKAQGAEHTLDLRHLASGVYIIHISNLTHTSKYKIIKR